MSSENCKSDLGVFQAGQYGPFATTHWSIVLKAGDGESIEMQEAWSKLCRAYWYPLYAYVRRKGYSGYDAQDLTQEFFARLVEKRQLAQVGKEKGRFRSFLLASMNHFLANEWDRARALKRGGGQQLISLDAQASENRYCLEPVTTMDPEKLFERRWALTLLETVLLQLRQSCQSDGKADLFDQLKFCLTGEHPECPYSEIAERLRMSEGAVKVAIHRLRHRYREALRAEIARTVSSAQEIEDELRHLFMILAG